MSITYPLTVPNNNIASMTMSLAFAVGSSISPFTFQQQVAGFAGERWAINFGPPAMVREDAEEWIAMALALRGTIGTFLASPPDAPGPRGVGTGTPLVKGAGQSGHSLLIDGATPSTTNWLRKGDYFQLGTGSTARLHKLVKDANSDGSGEATLEFMPALRYQPADNAPLVLINPVGLFRMTSNEPAWTVDTNKHYRFSFTAVEAL